MQDILYYISIFLAFISIVPFIRADYWIFRVFEYPRLQKFILTLILLSAIFLTAYPRETWHWVVVSGTIVNLVYLSYLVFPFTIMGRRQIIAAKHRDVGNSISILIANVYQENQNCDQYHDIIKKYNPDVILLVETNERWQQKMNGLKADYHHTVQVPLENTYGMLLYSRLPLQDATVNYLVEDDIPSITTMVTLPSGKKIKLFCLHPTPPVPGENPRSTERDKELLMVAEQAKECSDPVIVIGDLNDVAWSYTTELFGKISGLLDPRKGRGFFNSFHAKYFFLRFPLDHVFCSTDFSLLDLRRLPSCGSDHFPMFVRLQFDARSKAKNKPDAADADDIETANEKINQPTR